VRFRPRDEFLRFEEITRFVRVITNGRSQLRLTVASRSSGSELPQLVKLSGRLTLTKIWLTTNASIEEQAAALRQLGSSD